MSASAYTGLEIWEQLFVNSFLQNFHATDAFQEAKPHVKRTTAGVNGHNLLKQAKIQAALKERAAIRLERLEINQDTVLREVLQMAMLDPIYLLDDNGDLKKLSEIPAPIRRAIASLEVVALYKGTGPNREQIGHTKKIRLVSKEKMLELLGKHLGLWLERHEFSGPGGGPLEVNTTAENALKLLELGDLASLRGIKKIIDAKAREQKQLTGGNGNGK